MHPEPIPHQDEVTTEPQRQALEAMSHDLVEKLNAMVKEQEQRAHAFAAQQHSLSALPSYTLPEITPPAPLPQTPSVQPKPVPRGVKARMAAPQPQQPGITNGPSLPQIPAATAPTPRKNAPWEREYTMPTIIREPKEGQKEGSVGAGTILFIIIVIIFAIMNGCE